MIRSFSLESRTLLWRILWAYFTIVTVFSIPDRAPRGSFSGFHPENLVGFLEVKPIIVWRPTWLPRVSHPCASWPSASSNSTFTNSKLLLSNSHQCMTPVSLALYKQTSVLTWICLFLQTGAGSLLYDLSSLMNTRKAVDFQLVQLSCKDESYNFQVVHLNCMSKLLCLSCNWK